MTDLRRRLEWDPGASMRMASMVAALVPPSVTTGGET